MSPETKRLHGQYFTRRNIFQHPAFLQWAEKLHLKSRRILEPFAGENALIAMLQELDLCGAFASYDIRPGSPEVQRRDTLKDFPRGFDVAVTNPPYLAKNSAARRGITLPDKSYDDLYKYALHQCLAHTPHVAAIIPASFLNSGLFRSRLSAYIALPYGDMFDDTDHPVCLALFDESPRSTDIYEKDEFLGTLDQLEKHLPQPRCTMKVTFNHPEGNLGLRAVDGTKGPSIEFLPGDFLAPERVKQSSRNLSRIMTDKKIDIDGLNRRLAELRENTKDIFLTPFKGIREDGRFRRRLEFTAARRLILSLP